MNDDTFLAWFCFALAVFVLGLIAYGASDRVDKFEMCGFQPEEVEEFKDGSYDCISLARVGAPEENHFEKVHHYFPAVQE